MSNSRRLAVKFAILAAPAVLLSAAIGFGSAALRRSSLELFGPAGLPFEAFDAQFIVPDSAWKDPISEFFRDYRDRFARDQPFGRPLRTLTPEQKLTIIVTTDRRAFEREAKSETGARLEYNGGYFNPNKFRIIVEVTAPKDPKGEAKAALSHELVHAIMHYSAPNAEWSPWLSEGVAQWGETTDALKELGALDHKALQSAASTFRPGQLKELLGAGHGRFTGGENIGYYQSSYALVAFLLSPASGFRDRFVAYFAEEAQPGRLDSPARFRDLVGPLDEVEAKWLAWLRQQR